VTDSAFWRHVPSNLNPADVCSHGLNPGDPNWELFLKGPEFLRLDESFWPQTNLTPANKGIPEVVFNVFLVSQYEARVEKDLWAMHMTTKLEHWDRKLCRIAHFIKTGRALLEYHHNGRTTSPTLKDGIPGAAELQGAKTTLVHEIQAKNFSEEIKLLSKLNIRNPEARPELRKRNSRLLTLNPHGMPKR
jgi:hypothetical protein